MLGLGTPGRGIEVACDVDLERTLESFHAHAVPDGIDIRPGDTVLVHDMPDRLAFGERTLRRGRATVCFGQAGCASFGRSSPASLR